MRVSERVSERERESVCVCVRAYACMGVCACVLVWVSCSNYTIYKPLLKVHQIMNKGFYNASYNGENWSKREEKHGRSVVFERKKSGWVDTRLTFTVQSTAEVCISVKATV